MCSIVYIDKRTYSTQGELRTRLGLGELPHRRATGNRKYRRQRDDRFCLCPVDFSELAARLNCRIEYDTCNYEIFLDDHADARLIYVDPMTGKPNP